ncbi:MAG: hypothetical protein ABIW85_01915 [Variovorax sp.]
MSAIESSAPEAPNGPAASMMGSAATEAMPVKPNGSTKLAARIGDSPADPVTPLDPQSSFFTLPTAEAVLGALKPPLQLAQAGSGNDLLLEFPDVIAAGTVKIRLVSTMARTDGLWLITLHPPQGKGALLAAFDIGVTEPLYPDVTVTTALDHTQSLLLVARSLGKYYAVQREIKVGTPASPRGTAR